MHCPSMETLALFDRQQLAEVVYQDIEGHLSQPCHRCQTRLSWFQDTAQTLRVPLDRGPDHLMARARRLFQKSVYAEMAVPNILFARITFDSSNLNRRLGARSIESASHHSRHLLFHAELPGNAAHTPAGHNSIDIDVAVKRVGDNNITLRGQILCPETDLNFTDQLSIHLYRSNQHILTTTANQFGEFNFAAIAEGNYTIQIKARDWTTVINLPS